MQEDDIPEEGDGESVRLRIFDDYRGLLFSIAYRMLGSAADAEDMVQETFLRWRAAAQTDVQSPRAFLVTVISRLCINHLQSARIQREQYVGEWLPEPLITEPSAGTLAEAARIDGSLSMAFLVLLERLNPTERAVFLLREVFDYEYEEIGAILRTSTVNCRQLFRRARQHLADMRPRFDASTAEHEKLLKGFLQATSSGDLDGLVALLSTTAALHSDGGGKAAALARPVQGSRNVARALLGALDKLVPKNLVRLVTRVNTQPGIVSWIDGRPYAVLTIDVADGLIQNIYIVSNPEKLGRIGAQPN